MEPVPSFSAHLVQALGDLRQPVPRFQARRLQRRSTVIGRGRADRRAAAPNRPGLVILAALDLPPDRPDAADLLLDARCNPAKQPALTIDHLRGAEIDAPAIPTQRLIPDMARRRLDPVTERPRALGLLATPGEQPKE